MRSISGRVVVTHLRINRELRELTNAGITVDVANESTNSAVCLSGGP
jgi:hypothetical protein